jgi:hypothetical protein
MPLAVCGILFFACHPGIQRSRDRLRISVHPATLLADGWEEAIVRVEKPQGAAQELAPRLEFVGDSRGAVIQEVQTTSSAWLAPVRAGVLSGQVDLRTSLAGFRSTVTRMQLELDPSDSISDGTPDFLRLDDERDRQAFRRWFTFLVEEEYFHPAVSRAAEIDDCAALVRYAYREALHEHDGAWPAAGSLVLVPAMDSVRKYQFSRTPLGAALFRLRTGPFQASDLKTGAFGQFADAGTIERFNTYRVGHDLGKALPGDLLFFKRPLEHMAYHTMVMIGPSQISRSAASYVVYHTGPDGGRPGEMRRLSTTELLAYPDPQWRPVSSNPNFLGVYRWNILHEAS